MTGNALAAREARLAAALQRHAEGCMDQAIVPALLAEARVVLRWLEEQEQGIAADQLRREGGRG